LLLREGLWGRAQGEGEPNVSRRPPGVSPGLSDLLRKCLAPEASRRYRDAAAVGDDLRRHLNDLPLRGVSNRSPLERYRKWRRRTGPPTRRVTRLSTPAAIALAAALAIAAFAQRRHEAGASLEDGRRLRLERKYDDAARVLGSGLRRAAAVPST